MTEARKSDIVDISCMIVAEREKAIAITDGTVEFRDGRERDKWFWLPRSYIEIEPDVDKPLLFIVSMPEWMATEKGLV